MSGSATRGGDHGAADPWWGDSAGDDDLLLVGAVDGAAGSGTGPSAAGARRRTRRGSPGRGGHARQRSGIGWLLFGLALAPITWFGRLVRRTPWLRTWLVRLGVLLGILTVLACSVGVILINNVVVGRTAELGKLEDRRRELRRDNAVLGAQAARLEAPDLIHRRATDELGMVQTDTVPPFVYLFDGSRTMTERQRRRIAAAARKREAAARARASKDAAAASSTNTGGSD
ncbi:MAG: hypothetical protein KDC46_02850 [Thermoleophilia bacterium]|nr:hypothetical protein [Thermoleophilia bacterium]